MKSFSLGVLFLIIFLPQIVFATTSLDQVNQKVCLRFEEDLLKMAAIMEELRRRKGITETRVAFGGVDTPIKSADYWITFAHEALAFQKAKKFSSKNNLRYSLEGVAGKILRAKNEVKKALNYEK